ncbi:MAG: hypothetical protein DRO05_01560 [Thermoproteota archaeon]|nr:MAG: hypothetical protein DRO05_01560 [Candidatus Korarchaeota archaeon]
MSLRKLALFLLPLLMVSSYHIASLGCSSGDRTGTLACLQPQVIIKVFYDIQILSEEEAIAVVTFKADDQISWFVISSEYAQRRAQLISEFEKLISDSLGVDVHAVRRRGMKIDVENWKIWFTGEVNLSNSFLISKKGREMRICIKDPIYEEGNGWIDQINVTVSEGMRIVSSSPGENIVESSERGVLWVIPSLESASPSYCLNLMLKGLAIPSWVLVILSFVGLVSIYLLISRRRTGVKAPDVQQEGEVQASV